MFKNNNYYFIGKPLRIPNKWDLLRKVAKDTISEKAQLKLEWIIFYYTVGKRNKRKTAKYFGITRKTVHKWITRFDDKHLVTLEEENRAPKKKRDWEVSKKEEEHIRKLRGKNMEFGKKKLKVLYLKEYGEEISTWKIERVIRKYKLYPDPVKHKNLYERSKRQEAKVRIHQVKKHLHAVEEFGFLWHIDAIIIWWYGERRIIFTALEDKTKIAFARVYKSNTSGYAEDFLKRLMYLAEGQVKIIHSDNGSEFAGAFEDACKQLHIFQIFSRPYTPKDNSALERFNRTIQEEWLSFSTVGLDAIQNANEDLTLWLIKYNSYRPHEALDYLTPLEYAQKQFFQVSPMWPASTSSCIRGENKVK